MPYLCPERTQIIRFYIMFRPLILATAATALLSASFLSLPAAAQHDHHGHDHAGDLPPAFEKMVGSNKPVAYVNDEAITEAEIVQQVEMLPHMLTSGRDEEVRQAIIERAIQQRLVINKAKEMGVETDPEFASQLKTLKENLMFNFMISDLLDKELTPARLKGYYEEVGQEYAFNSVKAAHILVKTKDEAEDVIKRLDNGEKFADIAISTSTGPAAIKGGMLGWLARNTMVQPFEQAVFSLDAGEYTKEPVQTQFGWHVIKVYEVNPNYIPSFENLEGELQYKLGEQVVQDFMKKLEEQANIRYE